MSSFEDLVFSIGIDARQAKKVMQEVDKKFENLSRSITKKVASSNRDSAKESAKVFQTMFKEKEKYAEKANKAFVEKEKKARKSAKESAAIFQEQFKKREKVEKDLAKFEEAVNKERMNDIKRQNKAKEEAEKERLRDINRQNKALERQNKLMEQRRRTAESARISLQGSSSYQVLPQSERDKVMSKYDMARKDFMQTGDMNHFRRLSSDVKTFKRQLIGLQTIQGGLTDSTRNMVRAYASLFALIEGTQAIKNVGMDFQQMEAGMLVASNNAAEVGKNMEFVSKHAERLGMNLVDSTKAFVRIGAAAKNKIKKEDLEDLFLGIAEGATVMQLSMDDTTGALRAVQQIIQKGQVYAKSSLALHTVMYVE